MIDESSVKSAKITNAHKKICEALKEINEATDGNELFNTKMKLQEVERDLFLYGTYLCSEWRERRK